MKISVPDKIKNNDNGIAETRHEIMEEFLMNRTDFTISSGTLPTMLPFVIFINVIQKQNQINIWCVHSTRK